MPWADRALRRTATRSRAGASGSPHASGPPRSASPASTTASSTTRSRRSRSTVVRVDRGQPVVHLEELPHVPPRRVEAPRAAAAAPPASRRGRQRACEGPGTRSRAARSRARGSTRATGRAPRHRPRAGRGDRDSTPSRSRSGRPSRCGAGTRRSPSLPASSAGARPGRPGRAPRRSGRRRTPPGASAAGVARTTCSETASPDMPPSRNRYVVSGETTYGGLATTRSNCSPSTGSKKLPARVSTLPTPLSAALNAA